MKAMIARVFLTDPLPSTDRHTIGKLPKFVHPSQVAHPAPHIIVEVPVRSLYPVAVYIEPRRDGTLYTNTVMLKFPRESKGSVESETGLDLRGIAVLASDTPHAWAKLLKYAGEQWKPLVSGVRPFEEVFSVWQDLPDFFYAFVDQQKHGHGSEMAKRTTLMVLLWRTWGNHDLRQKECIEDLVARGCQRITEQAFRKDAERLGLPSLRRSKRS